VNPADFDKAIARLPAWIVALAIPGTVVAGFWCGIACAGGFLVGALAAYLNFRVIERAANRIARLAKEGSAGTGRRTGVSLLIQFGIFVLGAFVILRFSGFNIAAAFCGFLVCPAAALLEIVYELFKYGHS
jgi:hypothetical protein